MVFWMRAVDSVQEFFLRISKYCKLIAVKRGLMGVEDRL